MKLLLPKNSINIFNSSNDEDIKERILRLKCQVALFIPFFYIALVFSEVIIYSDEFNYLYNQLFERHEDIQDLSYFSELNMIVTVFKTLIILFIIILFLEYKDVIVDRLSRIVLEKILKNKFKFVLYGTYVKAKCSSKKWLIDPSDYYFCAKDTFQDSDKHVYIYQNNTLKSNKEILKKIKVVSENILIIDGTYYVKSYSEVYKQLPQKAKSMGYKLLKRPDNTAIFLPIIIFLCVAVGSILANHSMTNNFRGEYIFANVKNGSIKNFCESKKIQFKNNEILFNKQNYKVDNVTMQILDSNAEVVGAYTKQGILVFKDDSQNVSYYILKSSQLYKNTPNK